VREAKISHQVSNLGLGEEIGVRADAEWDTGGAQSQRERMSLRVGSKQDRSLASMVNLAGLKKVLDFSSHEAGLV
jgi:hypothetical protein